MKLISVSILILIFSAVFCAEEQEVISRGQGYAQTALCRLSQGKEAIKSLVQKHPVACTLFGALCGGIMICYRSLLWMQNEHFQQRLLQSLQSQQRKLEPNEFSALSEKNQKDLTKDCSINLMWINASSNISPQVYAYPSDRDNNFGEQYLNTLLTWAKKNSKNKIYFWIDTEYATKQAIQNTKDRIAHECDRLQIANIEIQDIRTLERVQKNQHLFSEQLPVYFRADLLRAIIIEKCLKEGKPCGYADFDVEPMDKSTLFNQETLSQLAKEHFVMAYEQNKVGFENSFQLFTPDEELLEAVSLMLVEANMCRAEEFLKDLKDPFFSTKTIQTVHKFAFRENVFYSYPLMHAYYHQLRNQSSLIFPRFGKPYNKETDGTEVLVTNAKILMTRSSALNHLSSHPIPTKKVSVPPSKSIDSLEA